jgi:hypothetical protein
LLLFEQVLGPDHAAMPTIVFQGDQDWVVHPSNVAAFLDHLEWSPPGPLMPKQVIGTTAQGPAFTRKHRPRDSETTPDEPGDKGTLRIRNLVETMVIS